ncbi:hypothetical protein [Haloplanus salinus]|jgi:hypothetical protein|uniref:hypothetical protein n=1 Tax=Haloplanus salinus TaxID=1126245 RepID=UPI0015F02FA5|nr:hypothetical protein [Haloplanus salinus]
MPSIDDYDEETVAKAYYVSEQIYRYGLRPVGYMRSAHRYAETNGARIVAKHIEKRLKD